MTTVTLNEVYEFLGIEPVRDIYGQKVPLSAKVEFDDRGEIIRWTVPESKKLDLEFGRPEFKEDGTMIIRMPFAIEEIKGDS